MLPLSPPGVWAELFKDLGENTWPSRFTALPNVWLVQGWKVNLKLFITFLSFYFYLLERKSFSSTLLGLVHGGLQI